ncbi:hypothetical protein [Pyxidicoccus trucidator]|uniref:hypothetical protein n=1 Tax=Pyxidicoccus trucidator TaxID=2709662 RepID=UPI0019688032|nr:hypothetical protein [Pyxidicoccus trucidator]
MRWDALPGIWTGELRFYPEEWGQSPAKLRLELARAGEHYTGVLRVTFPEGNGEGPFPVRAERSPEGTLRFTAPFGTNGQGPVRYEAVMDGNGRLVGTAAYEDPTTLDRMLGSWTLEPAR